MSPYHYELPDGTISVAFDDIYPAYIAGRKATWYTSMNANLVKVFDGADGKYVPSYEYCESCNYVTHTCGGCGGNSTHERGSICDGCAEDLRKEREAGIL